MITALGVSRVEFADAFLLTIDIKGARIQSVHSPDPGSDIAVVDSTGVHQFV